MKHESTKPAQAPKPTEVPLSWLQARLNEARGPLGSAVLSANSWATAAALKVQKSVRNKIEAALDAMDIAIMSNNPKAGSVDEIIVSHGPIRSEEDLEKICSRVRGLLTRIKRPINETKETRSDRVLNLFRMADTELEAVRQRIRNEFDLPATYAPPTRPVAAPPEDTLVPGTPIAARTSVTDTGVPTSSFPTAPEVEAHPDATITTAPATTATTIVTSPGVVGEVSTNDAGSSVATNVNVVSAGQTKTFFHDYLPTDVNAEPSLEPREKLGNLAMVVLQNDVIPALKQMNDKYGFDQRLSERRLSLLATLFEKNLLKVVRRWYEEHAEELRETLMTERRIYDKHPRRAELSEAKTLELFKKKLIERLTEARTAVLNRERGPEHSDDPDELSRAVIRCFREHGIEAFKTYIELTETVEDLDRLFADAAAKAPVKAPAHGHKKHHSIDDFSPSASVLARGLMPDRFTEENAPLSAAERAYMKNEMSGWMTLDANRGRRATMQEHLRVHFTGGILVRDDQTFKNMVSEIVSEIARERAATEKTKPAAPPSIKKQPAASMPPQQPLHTAPKPTRRPEEEVIAEEIATYVPTSQEIWIVKREYAASNVPGVKNKGRRTHYTEQLAKRFNRECWGSTKENPVHERDGKFAELLLRAVQAGVEPHMEEFVPIAPEPIALNKAATPSDRPATLMDAEQSTDIVIDETIIPSNDAADDDAVQPPIAEAMTPTQEESSAEDGTTSLPEAIVTTRVQHGMERMRERLRLTLMGIRESQPTVEELKTLQEDLNKLDSVAEDALDALTEFTEENRDTISFIEQADLSSRKGGLGAENTAALGAFVLTKFGSIGECAAKIETFASLAQALSDALEEFRSIRDELEGRHKSTDTRLKQARQALGFDLMKRMGLASEEEARVECVELLFEGNPDIADLFNGRRERFDVMREAARHYDFLQTGVLDVIRKEDAVLRKARLGAESLSKLLSMIEETKPTIAAEGMTTTGASTTADESIRTTQVTVDEGRQPIVETVESAPAKAAHPESNGHTSGTWRELLGQPAPTMSYRPAKGKPIDFPLNLVQYRLLQLLVVFPTVRWAAYEKKVTPISPRTYQVKRQGLSYVDLQRVWTDVFGGEAPTKEDIGELLSTIHTVPEAGIDAKLTHGPNKIDRATAQAPVIMFRNSVGHFRFIPSDVTYAFVRSQQDVFELTPDLEAKIVASLDREAREDERKYQEKESKFKKA